MPTLAAGFERLVLYGPFIQKSLSRTYLDAEHATLLKAHVIPPRMSPQHQNLPEATNLI